MLVLRRRALIGGNMAGLRAEGSVFLHEMIFGGGVTGGGGRRLQAAGAKAKGGAL